MKILVTGANGFVGRALCGQLIQRGGSVRAALRNTGILMENDVSDRFGVGDIGPNTNWEKGLVGVDCVIHLAARVHVMIDSASDPLTEFRRVNRDGTLRLAEQASLGGVRRFVYLSSIKVNGEETTDTPFMANDTPCPLDSYGISKAEAEVQLLTLAADSEMEVVIIRPPLIYGPGVKANFHKMMGFVARGIPLPFGAIHNKRSFVSLDNLLDLIIVCLEHPAAANQIFLAGDGEDLSTTDLLKRLGVALGRPVRLVPVQQGMLATVMTVLGKRDLVQRLCGSLQVDISKARDVLGWRPPITVDEGLGKTAERFWQEP